EILLVDVQLYLAVHRRRDRHRGEARVPPAARVEGAYAHQPVHPPLGREQPEDELPPDREGRALYPGLFPFGVLYDLQIEAAPLGPPAVHPGEHLGPVLRVDPASAGVYREDGVTLVVLSGEKP